MNTFTSALGVITTRVEGNSERQDEAENRVSTIEDLLAENKMREVEKKWLTDKAGNLENRMRRENVWVVSLKEGTEGEQTVAFFERWLSKILNMETKQGSIKIDRTQRIRTQTRHFYTARSRGRTRGAETVHSTGPLGHSEQVV